MDRVFTEKKENVFDISTEPSEERCHKCGENFLFRDWVVKLETYHYDGDGYFYKDYDNIWCHIDCLIQEK